MAKIRKFARNIDPLGRITLPKEILRNSNVPDGALFLIDVVDGKIVLTLAEAACFKCGISENLMIIDGAAVCRDCAIQISESLERSDRVCTRP